MDKIVDFVNISLRIRPALNQDCSSNSCLQVISKQPPVLLVLDRSQTYHFDNIFIEDVDQQTVYDETVKPLVDYVKKGYNCTVLAYGQTGTGKTYTMGTSSRGQDNKTDGLIPRTLNQFFEKDGYDESEINISVSFIEIYNEKVFDLLQDGSKSPLIMKGVKVQGFKQIKVYDCSEAINLLQIGNRNRHTGGTKQNSNSSRSHAVFTIYCNAKNRDRETCAKLNLVDLAGCESVKKTGNQGSTFQEGVNINKGLLCIGQVMTALSTNASFVPYRRSIITLILQDSLNTKNFVSLIACIKPNIEDCNETIQTLDFAQRVKKMKNKPEISEAINQYKKDNPSLFQTSNIPSTPFKRPALVQQTPVPVKRIRKQAPLKTINDQSNRSSGIDSPKNSISISMSSVYSNAEVTQENLSPIIKKYVNNMESSLLDKLETVIKNTLKRPSRMSLIRDDKTPNKENTPKISWSKIQNEVSKLVREEFVQLSAVATRAASSPLEDYMDFKKIKKTLNYDSPVLEENPENENTSNVNSISSVEFKIPEFPVAKFKKRKGKRSPPVESTESARRVSTRLSLKREVIRGNNYSTEESNISLEASYVETKHSQNQIKRHKENVIVINDTINTQHGRRFSVRLAGKKQESEHYNRRSDEQDFVEYEIDKNSNIHHTRRYSVRLMNKTVQDKNTYNDSHSLEDLNVNNTKEYLLPIKKSPDTFLNENNDSDICNTKANKRFSVRLVDKNKCTKCSVCASDSSVKVYETKRGPPKRKANKLTVTDTPAGKKLAKADSNIDSPITARTKHVLNVINCGHIKQLEQLHSVGPKTAQQILLFRDIKGNFNKISDLSQMPGWHGKKFEKFVAENFLKKELV